MDKLYIVMPAYNEEENMEAVVREWYPLLEGKDPESKLVVADSGSTDSTHDILLRLKEEFPQMAILSNTGRQHGPKLIALYDYAISGGADYIFQTDSDGQTSPHEFARFWGRREERDIILGSRTVRGDGRVRKLVEKVVCLLLRLIFGVRVPDANAPFRLMKAKVVKKYLRRIPKDYNLPNIMLTAYFAYYAEEVQFVEISFGKRRAGKNSVNLRKIMGIGWKAMLDFGRFRRAMN